MLFSLEVKTDEWVCFSRSTSPPKTWAKSSANKGETAKAIRTLLRICGSLEKARINLKIAEPEGGRRTE